MPGAGPPPVGVLQMATVPVSVNVPGYGRPAVPLAEKLMVDVAPGSHVAVIETGVPTKNSPVSVGGRVSAVAVGAPSTASTEAMTRPNRIEGRMTGSSSAGTDESRPLRPRSPRTRSERPGQRVSPGELARVLVSQPARRHRALPDCQLVNVRHGLRT